MSSLFTLQTSYPVDTLKGEINHIPSDKSISHRACMLAAVAHGESCLRFAGTNEQTSLPGDVISTIQALKAMGASFTMETHGTLIVNGVGAEGLQSPSHPLDLGNSGTAARLLAGIIGSNPITATITGDASLSKRPMNRVIEPLSLMGIQFIPQTHSPLPLTILGKAPTKPINYCLPVASAQVKTAVLFAALKANGRSTITEPIISRNHTENLLPAFGVPIKTQGTTITLEGNHTVTAVPQFLIPSDFSSAAFPIVAALITPHSDILLRHIGINSTRTGLLDCLWEMGAQLTLHNPHEIGTEPVADIRVQSSNLKGIDVPAKRVPLMIDEFPILAVAAASASGTTTFVGLDELRVKESDRLTTTYQMLSAAGVETYMDSSSNSLVIVGNGGSPLQPIPGGGIVDPHLDHRIGMSTLVLSMACEKPMSIRTSGEPVYQSSFPRFDSIMNALGAHISTEKQS